MKRRTRKIGSRWQPKVTWILVVLGGLVVWETPVQLNAKLVSPFQRGRFSRSLTQQEGSAFTPAPREMLRPLVLAQRAIDNKDFERAATLLGNALSQTGARDFLVPDPENRNVSVSLRKRAQTLLGTLTVEQRELYRLRFGIQAKQRLEQGIEEKDYAKIAEVMQLFFYTAAGFDAAMLMGHYHLDHGRPAVASSCFEQVVGSSEARAIHDPEASVLLATCWVLSGDSERAKTVLVDLKTRLKDAKIEFHGKPVSLFERPNQSLAWLKDLVGDSPLRNVVSVNQWLMAGGAPSRNAKIKSGLPLFQKRWSVPTLNHPDSERFAQQIAQKMDYANVSPIPSVQPLAVGNTVVMRTADQMVGVDFQTGKRVWVFPPKQSAAVEDDSDYFDESVFQRDEQSTLKIAPLVERLWRDSVYGQSSSDGQLIFVIPEPGYSTEKLGTVGEDEQPTIQRRVNELMAIDASREGSYRWAVGGQTGLDEPKLAGVFFVGAPLPLDDRLYAVCRRQQDISLVVLDSQTGKLLWQRNLGIVDVDEDEPTIDQERRLAGTSPSFADGILVCPTGTGALVGVDLGSRSLVWGYQYLPVANSPVDRSRKRGHDKLVLDVSKLTGLWRDTSIVISNGKVFFTPVDAQFMVAIDLQSGKPSWNKFGLNSGRVSRDDSLYLATVDNENAVLVGWETVRATNINTGRSSWKTDLGEYRKPAGRGYSDANYYFLPTTSNHILKIDLSSGKIVQAVPTDGQLGNLIAYRDSILSHSATELVALPQSEPLEKALKENKSNGLDGPADLAIESQLELAAGNLENAVRLITEAYNSKSDIQTTELLVKMILRLVESDYEKGIATAMPFEAQMLANEPFKYLRAKVDASLQRNNDENAIEALFDLLEMTHLARLESEFLTIDPSQFDKQDGGRRVRRSAKNSFSIRMDRWVGAMVNRIHARADQELQDRISARLSKLDRNTRHLNAVAKHDLFRIFSRGLLTTEISDSILRLLDEENEKLRSQQFSQTKTATDGGVKPEPKPVRWNQGAVATTVVDSEYRSSYAPIQLVLQSTDDPKYREYRYQFERQQNQVVVFDSQGKLKFKFGISKSVRGDYRWGRSRESVGLISIYGGVAILNFSSNLFAVDWSGLEQGSTDATILWSVDQLEQKSYSKVGVFGPQGRRRKSLTVLAGEVKIESTLFAQTHGSATVALGADGVCYLKDGQLICVDKFTGRRVWQRSISGSDSVLLCDSTHVVAYSRRRRKGVVFDFLTGRQLKSSTVQRGVDQIRMTDGCRALLVGTAKRELPKKENDEGVTGSSVVIGMYDFLVGKFVWKNDFLPGTVACVAGEKTIALRQPKNKEIDFVDLMNGETKFQLPLDHAADKDSLTEGLAVSARGNRYLVHVLQSNANVSESFDAEDESAFVKARNLYDDSGQQGAFSSGWLYSVDRETGESLWDRPVRLERLQMLRGQPEDFPFYLLGRSVRKTSDDNQVELAQLIAIDLDSGRQLTNDVVGNAYVRNLGVQCDVAKQEASVTFYSSKIIYRLQKPTGDSPAGPVANLTMSGSVPIFPDGDDQEVKAKEFIASQLEAQRQRAVEAQNSLPEKRAAEKRLLDLERGAK